MIKKNLVLKGNHNKPILLDIGYKENGKKKPVVILAHGFKGFKDWGHFNELMLHFIDHNFTFVKFNFSHNGGTLEQPIDFPDLDAFGNNNFSKELDDLKTVVDWIEKDAIIESEEVSREEIYLIGHSRGGGISIIAAHEDDRIKKLVTWASVADLTNKFNREQLDYWKKNGVIYVENTRTNQQMPLYYQLVEDTLANMDRFDIKSKCESLKTPHLIVHGTEDKVVFLKDSEQLHQWNTSSLLHIIDGAGHTFGAVHPYNSESFPIHVQELLLETINFLKQ